MIISGTLVKRTMLIGRLVIRRMRRVVFHLPIGYDFILVIRNPRRLEDNTRISHYKMIVVLRIHHTMLPRTDSWDFNL